VVVAVVVTAMVLLVNDNKKSPTAAASPTPSASSSESTDGAPNVVLTFSSVTVSPAVTGSSTTITTPPASAAATPSASTAAAAPLPQTTGPCGYSKTGNATKDVGLPPDPTPTPTVSRVVTLTSSKGPITMTLDGANAPCTVQSIAYLVGQKFYDGTTCFRLVNSGIFVLQCGDPANNGSGGPGYQVKDENLDKADYSAVGTVAMANAGAGTDGSQFFIITKDSSAGLQKAYTVIGHITAGMDIITGVADSGVAQTTAAASAPAATPSAAAS
jgi:peptidyl-prolyl cis-trans isomerase B (cyclophilin B)